MNMRGPAASATQRAVELAQKGDALADKGRHIEALRCYEKALKLRPDLVAIRVNAALSLRATGRLGEAIAALRRAAQEHPEIAQIQVNLGSALAARGDIDGAEAAYRAALTVDPNHAEAHGNLGAALLDQKKVEAALPHLRRGVAGLGGVASHWFNLGNALMKTDALDEAAQSFRTALGLDPAMIDAQVNLGVTHLQADRLIDAVACLDKALTQRPRDPLILVNLARARQRLGDIAIARAHLERLREIAPHDVDLLALLASDAMIRGQPRAAIARIAEAIPHARDEATAAGLARIALYDLQSDGTADAAAIVKAHRDWAARYAVAPTKFAFANAREPDRRLRVGFISADLKSHPVAYFLAPALEALDRAAIETVCYACQPQSDATTARLRAASAAWRAVSALDDAELLRRIRDDRIDILIDLSGHTDGSRLRVLMHRAAPVQATWLGYPGTTGVTAIDWRLSDAVCDPPEEDALSSERVLRLPGFLCYAPQPALPAVSPLPGREGAITFGSFNNILKLSDHAVRLFAGALAAVPGSRLVVKSSVPLDDETRRYHVGRIASHGVDAARVEMLPWQQDAAAHFAAFARVDIALDSFPYCGTTTTCETLWMGIPVVTRAGDRHAARVGASLMGQVGLPEFVAHSDGAFAAIAADWAGRRGDLAARRAGLRARVAASPLCDAAGFARNLEAAFRTMWHDWLARAP